MSDDIEMLRKFIDGVYTDKFRREARPNALAALERVEKERDGFRLCLKGIVADRDSLRAKLERAKEALKTVLDRDDPAVPLSEYLVAKLHARTVLAELSADAQVIKPIPVPDPPKPAPT